MLILWLELLKLKQLRKRNERKGAEDNCHGINYFVKLGRCDLIEEIMISEDKLIHFSGVVMGKACTIVLKGARYLFLFRWYSRWIY